jgi:uncharacterized membrane protein
VEAGDGEVSRDTRITALCLAALALIILGASTSATIAIAHGAPPVLRLPFKLLCHGIPHRCLTIFDTPMPVCARCVGIYGGFLVGLALFAIVIKTADSRQRISDRRQQTTDVGPAPHPRLLSAVRYLLSIAVIPILVDGGTQAIGLRESTNPLRLATGLTVGAAFGLWVLVSIETRARQRFAPS